MSIKKWWKDAWSRVKEWFGGRREPEKEVTPDPPAPPEPTPQPKPAPVVPHNGVIRSCWLRYGGKPGVEWCSFEYLRMSLHECNGWVQYLVNRGCNAIFITLSHTRAGISPYKNGFSGPFCPAKREIWTAEVENFRLNGITPILCLFDDTPPFHSTANSREHKRYIREMAAWFRERPVQWCTAMEPEEYWPVAYQDEIAAEVEKATGKAPWVHSTKENYLTPHTGGLLHEYGHPRQGRSRSPQTLHGYYRSLVDRHPDKPIVAWEHTWYTDGDDKALCMAQAEACLRAGCVGVGQW